MNAIQIIKKLHKDPASFRDSAGYVYYKNGEVYRYIDSSYLKNYELFIQSGLCSELIQKGYLLPFEEIKDKDLVDGARTIKPNLIPFISYPYEWSFQQIKDAAILTLSIQKIALKYGMELKDASIYNVQFLGAKPIFIDTLSFEEKDPGVPWKAYRQFCQHFLGPLTVFSYVDPSLKSLYLNHLDGINLGLVNQLLPQKAFYSPHRFIHLVLHRRFEKKAFNQQNSTIRKTLSTKKSIQIASSLVESLYSSLKKLDVKKKKSIWGNYYSNTNYSENSFKTKNQLVEAWVSELNPEVLWDLGANDGFFTEKVSKFCKYCVAMDFDLKCIENMYKRLRNQCTEKILPLHVDLSNPSPGIGWGNIERPALFLRGKCDVALALAVVHHLVVSASIPLSSLVQFFKSICTNLIIEYVPPEDSKFLEITKTNPNNFSFFTEDYFTEKFTEEFNLIKRQIIQGSKRVLFHFQI